MEGIINIYKEQGYTSHDVIARMRGISGQRRAGHTGTLDPDAEGVLPVCLGTATRVVDMLTDSDKTYEAVLLLGIDTDTEDISGEITARGQEKLETLSDSEISEAVRSFKGEYDQIPPVYSAIKQGGKKLCELAREGKAEAPEARSVNILDIEIVSDIVGGELRDETLFVRSDAYDESLQSPGTTVLKIRDDAYIDRFGVNGGSEEDRFKRNSDPEWMKDEAVLSLRVKRLAIRVRCSKGTYIRSLCRDIGEKLGCFATMEKLIRTRVGNFGIDSSLTLAQAQELAGRGELESALIATDECFMDLPALHTKEKFDQVLENGNIMFFRHFKEFIKEPVSPVRVYTSKGVFLAVYEFEERRKLYKPLKMFT
ncbi:MAG: tRNA pseudouridine(55) synthase TruB [Lachnospiraceae bacterium]|nr:tRNA pseudouridine(55) synthase TruB [Lachnospiraceae bacterium]